MASVKPYPVEHTFDEGVLTDFSPVKTPRTVLTGGVNMHFLNEGLDGEQQILQTDRGNAYAAGLPAGWHVMGGEKFNGIKYLVLAEVINGVATGRGQIGTFPSPEPDPSGDPDLPPPTTGRLLPRYRPLHNLQPYLHDTPSNPAVYPFVADEFNFSLEHPVQVELQPDYDGTVNIIFNDPGGQNPPRIINSRFAVLPGDRYKIIDRQGERDANLYNLRSFTSTLRLFQRSRSLVSVEFVGLLDGGQLPGGMWQYYFAYVNQDNQPTDVIAWSPTIPVFDGSHMGTIRGSQAATTRRVSLRLSGLDTDYQYVRCYAVRRFGEGGSEAVETVQLKPDLRLGAATLSFQHTGFEQTLDYDQQLLSLRTGELETFGPMAQVDNMLAFAGGRTEAYDAELLRDFAQGIGLSAAFRQLHCPGVMDDGQSHGSGQDDPFASLDWASTVGDGRAGGYLNPWNVAYRLGYPTGEALGFGIVFRLTNGTDSAVFPVRGHDHLLDTQDYSFDPADLDGDGWAASGENVDGVFRFPQLSAASYQGNAFIAANGRVTIMGIDFAMPQIPAAIRQAAVGCYFVRLKRNPDRLAQGYSISVLNSVLSSRDGEFHDHGHDQFKFCESPNFARRDANLKAIPAPAAILESCASHIDSADSEAHALPFEFVSYLTNGSRYVMNPWRLAFYSPDTVANPARVRSALHGRSMRMSLQAYMVARAAVRTTHPNEDGRGTFKLWKTVVSESHFIDARSVKGYWTEAGSGGVNDGGFGSQEKYLLGKGNRDDVRFLMQNNYDDYLGLVSSTNLDASRAPGSPWRQLTNSNTYGAGTGQTLGSNIASALPVPRVVAWLVNLYPEYSSDDATANQTQGARPRDVLRDLYNIDGEGYFPISPVMTWDQLESKLDYSRRFCCFGGDTYKGVSYRRLFTNIQVSQVVKEQDWARQIVGQSMSLVCESDVNPYAGREKEVQARPGEGAPRSWWAAVWEDSGRDARVATGDSYKAFESSGYNAGFANASGATLQLALPRNLPFRATEFPNQLAVTGTHIPGGYQNGYRRYLPGSAQTYRRDLGNILSLRAQGRTLVVGFERGLAIVAINERTQAGGDTAGAVFLEVRQILSPYCTVLSQNVGVFSQHATVATDQAVYGLDYAGFWRVMGGDFKLLSALRVDKLLLKRLRYLGSERADVLLRRMARLAVDEGRGDVIVSLINNAAALPAGAYTGPDDPNFRPSSTGLVDEPGLASPYGAPAGAGPFYHWSRTTCVQLVYSYRLDKWLPETDYPAQYHFSLGRQLYSIPLIGLGASVRHGIFRHENNAGVYYDRLHGCELEIQVTGASSEHMQYILNNLVLLTNDVLPVSITYEPLEKPVTVQTLVAPASKNIAVRNTEYRENRAMITVQMATDKERQRGRAIRVRIRYEGRQVVRVASLTAWLADSFS